MLSYALRAEINLQSGSCFVVDKFVRLVLIKFFLQFVFVQYHSTPQSPKFHVKFTHFNICQKVQVVGEHSVDYVNNSIHDWNVGLQNFDVAIEQRRISCKMKGN